MTITNFNSLVNNDSLYQIFKYLHKRLNMRLMSVVFYDSTPLSCKLRNFVENDIFIEILIEDRNLLKVLHRFYDVLPRISTRELSKIKHLNILKNRKLIFPPNRYFSSTKTNKYFGIRSNLHHA